MCVNILLLASGHLRGLSWWSQDAGVLHLTLLVSTHGLSPWEMSSESMKERLFPHLGLLHNSAKDLRKSHNSSRQPLCHMPSTPFMTLVSRSLWPLTDWEGLAGVHWRGRQGRLAPICQSLQSSTRARVVTVRGTAFSEQLLSGQAPGSPSLPAAQKAEP